MIWERLPELGRHEVRGLDGSNRFHKRGNHEVRDAHSVFTQLDGVSIPPGAPRFNCSTETGREGQQNDRHDWQPTRRHPAGVSPPGAFTVADQLPRVSCLRHIRRPRRHHRRTSCRRRSCRPRRRPSTSWCRRPRPRPRCAGGRCRSCDHSSGSPPRGPQRSRSRRSQSRRKLSLLSPSFSSPEASLLACEGDAPGAVDAKQT